MKKIYNLLEKYIPLLKAEKLCSLILFIMVVFTYKGFMVLIGIPLVVLIKKCKKYSLKNITYIFGYYSIMRILFSMIIGNSSIQIQGFRMLLFSNIMFILFSKKKMTDIWKDFKLFIGVEKIFIYVIAVILLGTIWNYISPGHIKSAIKYFQNMQIWFLCILMLPYMKERKRIKNAFYLMIVLTTVLIFYETLNNKEIGAAIINSRIKSVTIGITIYSCSFIKILIEKKLHLRFLYLSCCGIWIYLITYSGGRGSAIAVIFSSIFSLILIYRKRIYLCIPIILTVGSVFFYSNNRLNVRFKELKNRDFKNNASYARIALINAGIYTFNQNIIFGSGFDNTQKYFIEYRDLEFKNINNKNRFYGMSYTELTKFSDSHNIIIDYMASCGLFGIVLSFLFMAYIPIISLKDYIKKNIVEGLYCSAGFLTFLVGGMTWSTLTRHPKGIPFLVFLLILYLYRKREENIENDSIS